MKHRRRVSNPVMIESQPHRNAAGLKITIIPSSRWILWALLVERPKQFKNGLIIDFVVGQMKLLDALCAFIGPDELTDGQDASLRNLIAEELHQCSMDLVLGKCLQEHPHRLIAEVVPAEVNLCSTSPQRLFPHLITEGLQLHFEPFTVPLHPCLTQDRVEA